MSGEWKVEVIQIGEVEKHPNADTLSITKIHDGYPVIFQTVTRNVGELAVYVPVDSVVPNDGPFTFLFNEDDPPQATTRIKAKKLRGIFSMGLLVDVPNCWDTDGDGWCPRCSGEFQCLENIDCDLADYLGITKYEPPLDLGREDVAAPPVLICMPSTYDIEGLRRYAHIFEPGEQVQITEKIHGANMRAVSVDGEFHVGGRNLWLKRPATWSEGSAYWKAAIQDDLDQALAEIPGVVLFGEVYGKVMKLRYGLDQKVKFAAFDAWDSNAGEWWDPWKLEEWCIAQAIEHVPVLLDTEWTTVEAIAELAEGQSIVAGADHIREGIVIKPFKPRWSQEIGRVALKLHGEGYLTNKNS